MIPEGYQRVTRARPCQVCGKPDWCLIKRDGSTAVCPRVSEGSKGQLGDAGYIHVLTEDFTPPRMVVRPRRNAPKATRQPNFFKLSEDCHERMLDKDLRWICDSLQLAEWPLVFLRIGWSEAKRAYTFPMRDVHGNVIGVRTRGKDGSKKAIYGSKSGLFYIPEHMEMSAGKTMYVCEGPTDTAALIQIGLFAVGRSSCRGEVSMIRSLAKDRDIVIFSDADGPGRLGAESLADRIVERALSVKVVEPPVTNDARDWVRAGAKSGAIEAIVKNTAPWKESHACS